MTIRKNGDCLLISHYLILFNILYFLYCTNFLKQISFSFSLYVLNISRLTSIIINLYWGQMNQTSYKTPQKSSAHFRYSESLKYDGTPPTGNPRNSIKNSKIYQDTNNQINVNYKRILYDDIDNGSGKINRTITVGKSHIDESGDNQHQYAINMPSPSSQLHEKKSKYFNMSDYELKRILMSYEDKIATLKDYIHESEVLQKKRIIDIFGFPYINYVHQTGDQCDCYLQTNQSKLMIKQLSSRVSNLLVENSRLQSRQKERIQRANRSSVIKKQIEDERLLRQNQRLRAIISEYRQNQQENLGKYQTNQGYNNRIHQLEQYVRNLQQSSRGNDVHYKNRIIQLESHIRVLEQQNHNLILNRDESQRLRSSHSSYESVEFAKNQLTKTMFSYSQELQGKYKMLEDRVHKQNNKIMGLEMSIEEYKRQRQMKIQSTIKKSYLMSHSIKRPRGDDDPQIKYRDQEMNKDTNDSYQMGHHSTFNPKIQHTQVQYIQMDHKERKLYEQKIKILDMEILDLTRQIRDLESVVRNQQQKDSQKVSHILQLQKQMQYLQSQNSQLSRKSRQVNVVEREIHDPEIQQEIKRIKEILLSCNTTNYDLFFRQFSQIIEQRNIMNATVNNYQKVSNQLSKSRTGKQKTDVLNDKINELTQQNKKLLMKVAQLENDIENYHSEILMNQLSKLTEIDLFSNSEGGKPSGKQAIQWQKVVKSCIENSVARLNAIQQRMARKTGMISSPYISKQTGSARHPKSKRLLITTEQQTSPLK